LRNAAVLSPLLFLLKLFLLITENFFSFIDNEKTKIILYLVLSSFPFVFTGYRKNWDIPGLGHSWYPTLGDGTLDKVEVHQFLGTV